MPSVPDVTHMVVLVAGVAVVWAALNMIVDYVTARFCPAGGRHHLDDPNGAADGTGEPCAWRVLSCTKCQSVVAIDKMR